MWVVTVLASGLTVLPVYLYYIGVTALVHLCLTGVTLLSHRCDNTDTRLLHCSASASAGALVKLWQSGCLVPIWIHPNHSLRITWHKISGLKGTRQESRLFSNFRLTDTEKTTGRISSSTQSDSWCWGCSSQILTHGRSSSRQSSVVIWKTIKRSKPKCWYLVTVTHSISKLQISDQRSLGPAKFRNVTKSYQQ